MTQYNNVNIKLSNLQLDKLKSAARSLIGVILRLFSNIICINEINFPQSSVVNSGTPTLIISNDKANDIMIIIKSFEDFGGLLIIDIT